MSRRPHPIGLLLLCCAITTPGGHAQAQDRPIAIGTVQGTGATSPLAGQEVMVEGVVTAVMRTAPQADGARGWFLQDAGDNDPVTSDALFILDDGTPPLGQRMRVRGRVIERGGWTALDPLVVTPQGKGPLPHATTLSAPPDDWEPYENMRVKIAAPLTVAGTQRVEKHGELIVSFGGPLRTPSDAAAPGAPARALAADNARRTLRLDDGSDSEQPASVWYLPNSGVPRTGAKLSGVEGVVDQRGGSYRLQLTTRPSIQSAPMPPAPKVAGDVRIASFNLENFFNGDGRGGGFPTPRGARTPAELQTQLDKLVATIRSLNPDIAALMEVENDGSGAESGLAMLVTALNRDGGDWRFIDPGTHSGEDQIRVGLLYRASRVSPVGDPAALQDDLFGSRSRPPLAQTFRAGSIRNKRIGMGPAFTVVANHFKSKSCGEATGADADQKDGQGCWNAVRTESARRLAAWLKTDPTQSGSDLAVIVGDLNAYSMEDPVQTLVTAGWRDAFSGQTGATPYSYVYDSQIGRLDHALLSQSLASRLAGAAEWHSNADEPATRGYREAPQDRSPRRSSDHDPLVIGLHLRKP